MTPSTPPKAAKPADPLAPRNGSRRSIRLADDDPARVPWANLTPHPAREGLRRFPAAGDHGPSRPRRWLRPWRQRRIFRRRRREVTAFDLVESAVAWAKRRFPQSRVAYSAADLFDPPLAWRGAFDLVHECYTLQALAPAAAAAGACRSRCLSRAGWKLLLIARARDEDAAIAGPPWPLPPSIFAEAERQGLRALFIEDIAATAEVPIPPLARAPQPRRPMDGFHSETLTRPPSRPALSMRGRGANICKWPPRPFISFIYSHAALLAVVFAREGFDLHAIGLLLSLYAFPVIVFTFLSGAVARRVGVLNICRIAIALLVVGFFSLRYTASDFWPALGSRLVQGAGQGLLLSAFVTYAQSRLNERRFVYLIGLFTSLFGWRRRSRRPSAPSFSTPSARRRCSSKAPFRAAPPSR